MSPSMLNFSSEWTNMILSLHSNGTEYENLTNAVALCVSMEVGEPIPDSETLRTIEDLCTTKWIVYNVFVPVTLALGIPGNIAILITVLTMPASPAVVYIILMTVGDMTVLLIKCVVQTMIMAYPETLDQIDPPPTYWLSNLYHFSSLYPNWILVFIGFERLCAVRIPLLKSRIFTIRSAKLSGTLLLLAVVCVYMTVLMTTDALSGVWVATFSCFHSFLPLTCILITTVLTIKTLAQQKQKRQKMTTYSDMKKSSRQADRMKQCLTVMMVAAAISFLCLTTPMSVLMFLDVWVSLTSPFARALNGVGKKLSICLVNLTHSSNCYLYFLVAGNFRARFCNLILRRNRKMESQRTTE